MASAKYDLIIENHSNETDGHLALLRFPAMRSQFDNQPPDLIKMNIKPKSMKLKLDILIETNSPNYSSSAASYLASKSAPKSFSNDLVDRNVYTSTRTPVDDGQLFVAKIVNDKLVCRPVSDLFTMRSDFSHFDIKDEVDPKEEIKPVSVKFAAPERQGSQTRSSNILAAQRSAAEDLLDEYQTITYKPLESRGAISLRETLFGKPMPRVKPDPDAEQVDVKPHILIAPDIKPKIERMDVDDIYTNTFTSDTSNTVKNSSSAALANAKKPLSLTKQKVKDCLFKAKLVSFQEIYYYILGYNTQKQEHNLINTKEIIDALSELAVLVQGNWAIKSEVFYGDSSERECTDVTGISINLFISARDYLLWLFTQSRIVSRLEYSRVVRMPDHDIKELFNQLAIYRDDIKKWELKLPTDEKFIERFPDVVSRQATFWKVRRANKLAIFN